MVKILIWLIREIEITALNYENWRFSRTLISKPCLLSRFNWRLACWFFGDIDSAVDLLHPEIGSIWYDLENSYELGIYGSLFPKGF